MKAIIRSIITLTFLLLYTGCGEYEEKSTKLSKNDNNNSDINVTNPLATEDILIELGLDIKNQKISMDFNKTTKFLKKMEIEMHGRADALEQKIEKADINFTRDIGISFTDEKVEIDFNKTKKMFQRINILMKDVLLDKNSSDY